MVTAHAVRCLDAVRCAHDAHDGERSTLATCSSSDAHRSHQPPPRATDHWARAHPANRPTTSRPRHHAPPTDHQAPDTTIRDHQQAPTGYPPVTDRAFPQVSDPPLSVVQPSARPDPAPPPATLAYPPTRHHQAPDQDIHHSSHTPPPRNLTAGCPVVGLGLLVCCWLVLLGAVVVGCGAWWVVGSGVVVRLRVVGCGGAELGVWVAVATRVAAARYGTRNGHPRGVPQGGRGSATRSVYAKTNASAHDPPQNRPSSVSNADDPR